MRRQILAMLFALGMAARVASAQPQLLLTPAEVLTVARMRALINDGKSVSEVVQILDADGFRRSTGALWTEAEVAAVLREPMAIPSAVDNERAPPPDRQNGPDAPIVETAGAKSAPARLAGLIAGANIGSKTTGIFLTYWSEYVGITAGVDFDVENITAGDTKVKDTTVVATSGQVLFGVQFGRVKPRAAFGVGYVESEDATGGGTKVTATVVGGSFGADVIFLDHLVAGVTLVAIEALVDGNVKAAPTSGMSLDASVAGYHVGVGTAVRIGYLF